MKHLITVNLSTIHKLTYRVDEYRLENGRVLFEDPKTGLPKDFPYNICYIEGVYETRDATRGRK